MIWWFLGSILFAIGILIFVLESKANFGYYFGKNKVLQFISNHDILFFIIVALCIVIGITVLVCNFVTLWDYNDFCTEFILLKDYYENFNGTNHTIDIFKANRNLIKLQTNYLRYGLWTVIPASVMDIVPIGG